MSILIPRHRLSDLGYPDWSMCDADFPSKPQSVLAEEASMDLSPEAEDDSLGADAAPGTEVPRLQPAASATLGEEYERWLDSIEPQLDLEFPRE